jgi:hypothetical protein
MNNLYLEKGEIFVVDAPEKPEFKGDYFLHYGPQKMYEETLKQALSNKIEVAPESRELAKQLIAKSEEKNYPLFSAVKGEMLNRVGTAYKVGRPKEKTLYPIENLEVEKKQVCQHKGIHNSTCIYKQYAILTIKK